MTYICAFCKGPVSKPPAGKDGLGSWRCVNKNCRQPARSTNKAGALFNGWRNPGGSPQTVSPIQTGQSPKARVMVKR